MRRSNSATLLTYDLDRLVVPHLDERGSRPRPEAGVAGINAKVVAYLDVDPSTDLRALPPLIAPLLSGHSDIAIGTRLATSARVTRGGKREFVSRCYNLLLRRLTGARFSDAQCGFKAMRDGCRVEATAARRGHRLILRHRTADSGRAQRDARPRGPRRPGLDREGRPRRPAASGARPGVRPDPVDRVYAELGRHPFAAPRPPSFFGQMVRFVAVGVLSTAAYALLLPQRGRGMSAASISIALAACLPAPGRVDARDRLDRPQRVHRHGRRRLARARLVALAAL